MAELTAWGIWLDQSLRAREMTRADLADATGRSRSIFSELMNGKAALSPKMRRDIARALKVTPEEVPLPETLSSGTTREITRTGVSATPVSYFAKEDQPPAVKLTFLDDGIPDHGFPRLAAELGFFQPFNIDVNPRSTNEREYPRAHIKALEHSGDLTLVSAPLEVLVNSSGTPLSSGTPVARVNQYHGFALIANAQTGLASVADAKPDSKLDDFQKMVSRITTRRAENNVAFIDQKAMAFYRLLFKLFTDVSSAKIQPSIADDSNRPGVLESLHEIGTARVDFVVGHANTVAAAKRAAGHYEILIHFSDLWQIVDGAYSDRIVMSRLMRNPEYTTQQRAGEVSITDYDDQEPRERTFRAFRSYYKNRLDELTLNNVWAVNLDAAKATPDEKALLCRIASIAYRTAASLLDEDKSESEIRSLFQYAAQTESPQSSYRNVEFENFLSVWNQSYRLTSFNDTHDWLCGDTPVLPDRLSKPRNGLCMVTKWLQESKKIYETIVGNITDSCLLNNDHAKRAMHHYQIFNYWDAARYAEKLAKSL